MGNLVLTGATSGSTTVQATDAVTATITLPSVTGTLAVNGPAFSAFRGSTNQSFTAATWTKVQLQGETFDTNNNYDTSLYRFTPTVAGYYQINATIYTSAAVSASVIYCAIYKNGSVAYYNIASNSPTANLGDTTMQMAQLISMNGSTDYLEMYIWSNGTTPVVNAGNNITTFSGSLVRSA